MPPPSLHRFVPRLVLRLLLWQLPAAITATEATINKSSVIVMWTTLNDAESTTDRINGPLNDL